MRRFLALLLTAVLLLTGLSPLEVQAASQTVSKAEAEKALGKAVAYLNKYYSNQQFQNMLEDWAVVALAAAGEDMQGSKWTQNGKTAQAMILQDLQKGTLLKYNRNTDYQRVVLSLAAMGIDPKAVYGKNYLEILSKSQLASGKFADSVNPAAGTLQGDTLINAQAWGIIALAASNVQNYNSELALKWLTDHDNEDGGYSIDTTIPDSDIDMSAMILNALVAMGETKDSPSVKSILTYLKANQQESGGFAAWNLETAESAACVIQGLTALGIDPQGAEWTAASGNPVTALLAYQLPDGSFAHYEGGKANLKATAQAVMALADYVKGSTMFQRLTQQQLTGTGLFSDVDESHPAYQAIKELVAAKIVTGYPDNTFRPANPVSRAEFAKMLVTGKGFSQTQTIAQFKDLATTHWANKSVAAAVDQGLLKGVSPNAFAPNAQITGAEVAAILVRAAGYAAEAEAIKGSKWYSGYVEVAQKHNLLYADFKADLPATRSQCAVSLVQMIQE